MDEVLNTLKQLESNQFQEELVKTYFSTASSKKEHPVQSGPTQKERKIKRFFYTVIIGLMALAVAGLFIFNRIIVDIKIIPVYKSNLADLKSTKAIYLNREGDLNTDVIKNVVFYENSSTESRWGKDVIVLSNEIVSKRAVLGIDFARPLNLNERLFCFYSKGKNGGEELRISLKDGKNNICHSKINELQNLWQQFTVNAEEAKEFIDLGNITHIDLEVNPDEKQNLSRSTIYFKDIYLANKEEI